MDDILWFPRLTSDRLAIEMCLTRGVQERVNAGSYGIALRLIAPRGGEILVGFTAPGLDAGKLGAFLARLKRSSGAFEVKAAKMLPLEKFKPAKRFHRMWVAPVASHPEDYIISNAPFEPRGYSVHWSWIYMDTTDSREAMANVAFQWLHACAVAHFHHRFVSIPDFATTLMRNFADIRFDELRDNPHD